MSTTVYAVSEGQRFAGDATLVVVECATCHVTYAIPESFNKSALKWRGDRKDGRGWKICCPFGHQWWYVGETETEKLKRQRDYQADRAARLAAERDQAEADAHAQKSVKTRFKNERDRIKARIAAGVCPCCNRSFKDVKRHMASQHPDYAEAAPSPTDSGLLPDDSKPTTSEQAAALRATYEPGGSRSFEGKADSED